MKKLINFHVIDNQYIAAETYCMTLTGDCSSISVPGQFVNIALEGKYLRRPISVCNVQNDKLTLIYKIQGDGTKQMSCFKPGKELELLTGLGNGFRLDSCGNAPLLIGGGAGVAPLYWLAQVLISNGKSPLAILGFNTKAEIFMTEQLNEIGVKVFVSTADGSFGTKGFVTDVLSGIDIPHDYLYVCGPEPMLKAVYTCDNTDGQFSFEARMACGFGACMGCSCETKYGTKRICRDGPILERGEIRW